MTLKIHHLVAATDDKTGTQLTNIYAETYEQAVQEAHVWHAEQMLSISQYKVAQVLYELQDMQVIAKERLTHG